MRRRPLESLSQVGLPRAETIVGIERATEPTLASKGRAEEPRESEPTPYELFRIEADWLDLKGSNGVLLTGSTRDCA
jgi:hypothetical protein